MSRETMKCEDNKSISLIWWLFPGSIFRTEIVQSFYSGRPFFFFMLSLTGTVTTGKKNTAHIILLTHLQTFQTLIYLSWFSPPSSQLANLAQEGEQLFQWLSSARDFLPLRLDVTLQLAITVAPLLHAVSDCITVTCVVTGANGCVTCWLFAWFSACLWLPSHVNGRAYIEVLKLCPTVIYHTLSCCMAVYTGEHGSFLIKF